MRRLATSLAALALLAGCAVTAPASAPASAPGTVTTSPSVSATPSASPSTKTPSPSPTRSVTPAATPTPSKTATKEAKPLTGRRIVIDPGHNGVWTTALNRQVPAGNGRTKACNTSGTAGGGYSEHAFTWASATVLAARLRALGATVVLTRQNDTSQGPCVNVRAAITNKADADALVSLHADGNLAAGARGYHIIVSSTMAGGAAVEKRSVELARAIRAELDATGMPRSTYIGGGTAIHSRTDIAGLNLVDIPGVMLELGNMRNAKDLTLLRSLAFKRDVADAIASALIKQLG